jgi:N utilization substance protein B
LTTAELASDFIDPGSTQEFIMINPTHVPIDTDSHVDTQSPVEAHEHVEALEPPLIEAEEMFENDPIRDRTLPKRRLARERVLQILYAQELGGGEIDQLFWDLAERELREADERAGITSNTPPPTQQSGVGGGRGVVPNLLNSHPPFQGSTSDSPPPFEGGGRGVVIPEPEPNEGALEFARALARALTLHREEINQIITEKLQRWEFSRVALIDRILIQMGIAELLYFPDIPPKASINELIEIAKDYSTEESGKFINGILHAIMTHLNETGKIQKSGRGLMEESAGGYRPAKRKQ